MCLLILQHRKKYDFLFDLKNIYAKIFWKFQDFKSFWFFSFFFTTYFCHLGKVLQSKEPEKTRCQIVKISFNLACLSLPFITFLVHTVFFRFGTWGCPSASTMFPTPRLPLYSLEVNWILVSLSSVWPCIVVYRLLNVMKEYIFEKKCHYSLKI